MTARSYAERPPSHWGRWRFVASRFWMKLDEDRVFDRASALAFQALSSLIPLLALAYFLFAALGGFERVRDAVETYAIDYLAPSVGDQVKVFLRQVQDKVSPKAIGVFGVLGFLWTGINMVARTEESLNAVWGIVNTRTLRQRLWLYTLIIVVAPVVLGGSLAITSFLAESIEGAGFASDAPVLALALVPYVMSGAFLSFAYWLLPRTRVGWRSAIKAGVVAGLALEGLKSGYAFYAALTIGDSVYGSLAALPILVLWIWLASLVFLAGAELCYFLEQRAAGVFHVAEPQSLLSLPMLVDILRLYEERRQRGSPNLPIKDVVGSLRWDQSVIYRHVHYLEKLGLLAPAERSARGEECFRAAFDDLPEAVQQLLADQNRVKSEEVEIDRANVREEGFTAIDSAWSRWGLRRARHEPLAPGGRAGEGAKAAPTRGPRRWLGWAAAAWLVAWFAGRSFQNEPKSR